MPFTRPRLIKRIAKAYPRLGSRIKRAHTVFIQATYPLRRRVLNTRPREAFARQRPVLDEVQKRTLRDLQERGIAFVPIGELVGGDTFDRLSKSAEAWLASDAVKAQEKAYPLMEPAKRWKEYLIRYYPHQPEVEPTCEWLRFGVNARVLDVVNSYLGLLSKLIYVDVWHTQPLRDVPDFSGSQRWHRDPEDSRLVKVFLFLSDVGEDSGPMHYVPYSRAGERFGHLWPQRAQVTSLPPPEEFDRTIPRSSWAICAQPRGTLVFVDTTGFHMGGRLTSGRRIMGTWTYVSPASLWPRTFSVKGGKVPFDNPAARFALDR